jgi:hypothetical protein
LIKLDVFTLQAPTGLVDIGFYIPLICNENNAEAAESIIIAHSSGLL